MYICRLQKGDCGSFVFLEPDKDEKTPIAGIFFGVCKLDPRIHQAAILSWNMKQVEGVSMLNIKDICLAEHLQKGREPNIQKEDADKEDVYYRFQYMTI